MTLRFHVWAGVKTNTPNLRRPEYDDRGRLEILRITGVLTLLCNVSNVYRIMVTYRVRGLGALQRV